MAIYRVTFETNQGLTVDEAYLLNNIRKVFPSETTVLVDRFIVCYFESYDVAAIAKTLFKVMAWGSFDQVPDSAIDRLPVEKTVRHTRPHDHPTPNPPH